MRQIGKDFMLSHGYIKNDFDVVEWAAPEFLEQAATEVLKEEWQRGAGASCLKAAGSRWKGCGSGSLSPQHPGWQPEHRASDAAVAHRRPAEKKAIRL